jgi:PAS domain S-box-containing protein
MPDGRILAFGHGELALGDGVRWDVFRQAADDPRVDTVSVAVDQDGRIYAGMADGFSRIEFNQNGGWRYARIEPLPADLAKVPGALTSVSVVGGNWFWCWNSGPIIAWKPGSVPNTVGQVNALERIFAMGADVFMSDQSNGMLCRLENGHFNVITGTTSRWNAEHVVTCAVPLGDGTSLVGGVSFGLSRFDGTAVQPLVTHGVLAGGQRINDLCDTGYGLLAVAVDNAGIVFIDRTGRIVQSLDRSVDNRLARVKRLLRTPGGVLWGLLNEGIVRISFPSRFSSFESMVSSGLAVSQPLRHDGRLWLLADGQAARGVYDDDHRFIRFESDTPGPYVASLVDLDDVWMATTENGTFRYESGGGWKKVAQGPVCPYLRAAPVEPGCWLFAAEKEVGWLRHSGGQYVFEAFPEPGIKHVYGSVTDAHGVFWAELGTGSIARIEPTLPRPTVEVLGPAEGLPNSWVQLFLFEGEVRANAHEQILRYDPVLHRFAPDADLMRRVPSLVGAIGRPASDARGRLWVTRPEDVLVVDPRAPLAVEPTAPIPEVLRPRYFTLQSDGVMWMNEPMRLARFDPALPAPAQPPLRAQITRVELPSSGLVVFPEGDKIPDLAASNSTMVVHYLAPNQPFGQSVSFEEQLSGSGGEWVSTGSTGSVTFNHLDPGVYRLNVRPRLGPKTGEEAHLEFSILAPWYRTRLAYLLTSTGALGVVLSAIWLATFLQRREKNRLERLVAIRTGELHATNRELERQIQETTEKTAALQASEERFRRLNDNAPDIIFRIRVAPDVGFDYVSPAVTSITGYRPEEFLADPAFLRKIVQPPGAETIFDNALARRVPDRIREVRWATRDGRVVTLEERLSPVCDATGNLVAIEGIVRDFTERKLLEEQLRQSQRMEAVGQLAGGVAHDYNNILTSTLMQLGLLLGDPTISDEMRHSLIQLVGDAERAASLTRQLLMFSRRQVIQIKQIDLNEVLANLLKMLRRLLGETISLEFRGGENPLWINADAGMIEQVVTNLCVNARDAMMPNGGRLTIDARLVTLDAEAEKLNPEARPGLFVRLVVADTGSGMDTATMKHLFEPFFTTKDVGKGTGLGLATVYGITKQHGGWIEVESEVGRGSIFRVFLPAQKKTASTNSGPAEEEARKGRETILLVEDDQAVRDTVVLGLKRFGYRVLVAADGQEATEVWSRLSGEIDLLFTDIRMPGGMSGLELYERFKQAKPALQVIVSSGYSEEIVKLGRSVNPMIVFLPKPYDVKTLVRTVRRCLDQP